MHEPSTPRSDSLESEVTWLGTAIQSGFSPREYLRSCIDPRILNWGRSSQSMVLSNRAQRAERRNANTCTPISQVRRRPKQSISPQAQQEMERLQEYIRSCKTRQSLRRIIKAIQDKRRDEFISLRSALCKVYKYNGPYLQKPGEKEAAADVLRVGSLGAEFVNEFDSQAKWQWLQIQVDAL
ncbi:hypothetical protein DFH28DRAFT_928887 [Melampsora americana]|nr:hypothetical protein DFH28DRAFT_928887 [Melampsora americana]